jgi:hypothetical protein
LASGSSGTTDRKRQLIDVVRDAPKIGEPPVADGPAVDLGRPSSEPGADDQRQDCCGTSDCDPDEVWRNKDWHG